MYHYVDCLVSCGCHGHCVMCKHVGEDNRYHPNMVKQEIPW